MVENKYEYQLQLINRRWQYFAAYLLVIGLLANSIPKELFEKPEAMIKYYNSLLFILTIIISIGLIFTHLVSITTQRIEKIELSLKKEETITHLNLSGQFLGVSETLSLYLVIYLINSFLTYCTYGISIAYFIVLTIVQIINLFFLKWKAAKRA